MPVASCDGPTLAADKARRVSQANIARNSPSFLHFTKRSLGRATCARCAHNQAGLCARTLSLRKTPSQPAFLDRRNQDPCASQRNLHRPWERGRKQHLPASCCRSKQKIQRNWRVTWRRQPKPPLVTWFQNQRSQHGLVRGRDQLGQVCIGLFAIPLRCNTAHQHLQRSALVGVFCTAQHHRKSPRRAARPSKDQA